MRRPDFSGNKVEDFFLSKEVKKSENVKEA